jgi:SPW repeat
MARLDQISVHKSWEDWTILVLGAALVVSPAFDPGSISPLVLMNAIVVGFLILCLALSELVLIERWDERANCALGVWMIVAPAALGYFASGTLWFWHMAIGAAVTLLALLELWQDWGLSDVEMAKHDQ